MSMTARPPWQDAADRGNWDEAERIKAQVFADIEVQQQIEYYLHVTRPSLKGI